MPLRPSGGYRQLRSFQVATVIYDATASFCERFLDARSRLVDQMVQAARSGRQNIAEGSRASAASSQTELRLVNVARASLDELLLDYEDFLRQRGHAQWTKDSREAETVRRVGRDHQAEYAPWLDSADPAVVANTLICLIHQANFLLDRQIAGLEREFIEEGGYTERLATARVAFRASRDPTPSTTTTTTTTTAATRPLCGNPMAVRTARTGRHAGTQFLGCTADPQCKGIRPL